jgi:hypothetical protein
MTDIWAARLLMAMDNDEIGEDTDVPAESDPGPGPWDAAPNAVADNVIAAAVLGYPTDEDADTILTTPGALERLTRRWAAVPPSDELLKRAMTNPALRRLLTGSGAARHEDETTAEAELQLDRPQRGPERLRSLQVSDFTLAAADRAGIRQEEAWSGGRIIRQRLQDGSTAVTAEYAGSGIAANAPGEDPYVVALSVPDEEAIPLLLVILIPVPEGSDPAAGKAPLVGQAVVAVAAAIGELHVAGPVRVSALTDTQLAAVPDSVAWARGPWNTAWRHAARSAGKGSPLYEAVLRGTRRV